MALSNWYALRTNAILNIQNINQSLIMEAKRIRKRCKTVGCPNLHYNSNGYCDSCNEKWKAKHPRASYADDRPSAYERGYDNRWRKFAKSYLSEHPVCAMCGAPSTCVDHKDIPADVMMRSNGRFDYDERHYQALCRECNLKKGRTIDKRVRNGYEKDLKWLNVVKTT